VTDAGRQLGHGQQQFARSPGPLCLRIAPRGAFGRWQQPAWSRRRRAVRVACGCPPVHQPLQAVELHKGAGRPPGQHRPRACSLARRRGRPCRTAAGSSAGAARCLPGPLPHRRHGTAPPTAPGVACGLSCRASTCRPAELSWPRTANLRSPDRPAGPAWQCAESVSLCYFESRKMAGFRRLPSVVSLLAGLRVSGTKR
jgi:hypothetical protein